MNKSKEVEEYLLNYIPEFREIANRLIGIIFSTSKDLSLAIKWKRLTFGFNDDFHHWICAIDITKNYVSVIFHFGGLLEDKKNLFKAGTSKFLRKLEIRKNHEINEEDIKGFIIQAIDKLQYFKDNWKEISKGN